MPTRPLDHGCAAAHATHAAASSPERANGRNGSSPPERYRPRASTTTTTKPWSTARSGLITPLTEAQLPLS
jgi:hypothetical protein